MFNNPSAYAQDMLLMGYSNFWSPIFCKDKVLLFNRMLQDGSWKKKAGSYYSVDKLA
ncbi:hypothetical protein [Chryseobacterium sp. GVT01B]|uniref:hypothetical protein n=1 Tax=Chryseobacterium sp. GVT01B TaxID=2862675 RepID=UPI001CC18608|nr:hypothetical protein [Chryseobacterium sp. GVT01B]